MLALHAPGMVREKVRDAVSFVILWAKAKVMAPNAAFKAVFIILGALAVAWLLEKIDLVSLLSLEARSQETGAVYQNPDFPSVTAIAPTVTAPKPRLILIPPGQ
jgi:hypothetical protein